jgi:hypothetical protein
MKSSSMLLRCLVLAVGFLSRESNGANYQLGGIWFDGASGATAASVTGEGGLDNTQFVELLDPNFETAQTVGRLAGVAGPGSAFVELRGSSRSSVTLAWSTPTIANGAGDDLAVFLRTGGPESFFVAVRQQGESTYSAWRAEFADALDTTSLPLAPVLATAFDLTDFGLAPGALH